MPAQVWATALGLAVVSAALTPALLRLAGPGARSRWVRSGLHVVLAALGGAGVGALAGSWADLLAGAAVALGCALLAVVDLASSRLPNALTGPTAVFLLLALAAGATMQDEWARLGRAAAAGAALFALYLLLALANPSGLGLGDVKLAGILGGFLGWYGWPQVLLGAVAGFLLGGLAAAAILVTRRGTLESEFPFGPWMIVGAAGALAVLR